jgi:hypothetical protein
VEPPVQATPPTVATALPDDDDEVLTTAVMATPLAPPSSVRRPTPAYGVTTAVGAEPRDDPAEVQASDDSQLEDGDDFGERTVIQSAYESHRPASAAPKPVPAVVAPPYVAPRPHALPTRPPEERAPGASDQLPANPFADLSPEALRAFVDITLFEEEQVSSPAEEAAPEKTPRPPAMQPLAPMSAPMPVAAPMHAPPIMHAPPMMMQAPPMMMPPPMMPLAPMGMQPPLQPLLPPPAVAQPSRSLVIWIFGGILLSAFVSMGLGYLLWGRALSQQGRQIPPSVEKAAADQSAEKVVTLQHPGEKASASQSASASAPASNAAVAVVALASADGGAVQPAPVEKPVPAEKPKVAEKPALAPPPAEKRVEKAAPHERRVEKAAPHEKRLAKHVEEKGTAKKPAPDPGEEKVPAEPGGRCRATITSSPNRSSVWVGEEDMGETPLRNVSVPCGVVLFTFQHSGYHVEETRVKVGSDKPAQVFMRLVSEELTLTLSSVPGGASFEVDGKAAGTGPVSVLVTANQKVKVVAKLPGHQPWTREVSVKTSSLSVRAELKPLSAGGR